MKVALSDLSANLMLLDKTDRLDWLISQGDSLAPLNDDLKPLRDSGQYSIAECMAPVFFFARLKNGVYHLAGDVPKEAPTARGFVGFLVDRYDGQEKTELVEDMLTSLHIRECLSMQRQRGLSAIYERLKRVRSEE